MGSETYVHEYEEGTLILDIVEPLNRDLLWRGSAEAKVDRQVSAQRKQKRIKKAVKKILSHFPPNDLGSPFRPVD